MENQQKNQQPPQPPHQPEDGSGQPRPRPRGPNIWFLLILLAIVGFILFSNRGPSRDTIDYSFFIDQIERGQLSDDKTKAGKSNVKYVEIGDREILGVFDVPPEAPQILNSEGKWEKPAKEYLSIHFRVNLTPSDQDVANLKNLLRKQDVRFRDLEPDNTMTFIYVLLFMLPLAFILFMWISYRRAQNQILGGGFLSGFSKSPAKRYEVQQQPVTFKDVAGLEGVKADLMEIVDYLKSPDKFTKLGGRVPKGVLLNGAPGTGKTLLARAIAGEAGVPYFSVSGSEFIQMFVGVGASRVRDLFKTAKEQSPAIIFIDEIDAVGRQRGAGLGGGHDEREQTLNQILSEMDGFTQTEAVIVVAATNRPDVLDPALLRPGRFDRHITVNRPTHKGRVEIFKVHVRDVPLADDVDLDVLASTSVGLTGADIRNIVNEAALWAARHDKSKVDMSDFGYSHDKVLMGAKREEVINEDEKEKTAYHEAGHTLIAWNLEGAPRVHKVTVIPRGRALGATQMLPGEDRLNMSEHELRDSLVVSLGGRAAEKLVFDEFSVGAENDLERATSLARRMVTHWGMSERLGPVSYKLSDEDPFLGREIHQQRQFSEHTMELIDDEVARILHEASENAQNMIREKREDLDKLARALIEDEELDDRDITELIGPSVQSRANSNGKPGGQKVAAKESTEQA